jgi:hypothetical protein
LKWKEEKQKEKEEEEAEKARAAAEAAETARREKEELDKWIGTFSIEAGGTGDEALQEESQVPTCLQWMGRDAERVARDCWSRGSWRSSSPTFSSKRSLFLLCTFITASTSHTLQLTFVQVVQLDALADVFKLTPVEVRRIAADFRLLCTNPPISFTAQAAARVVALEQMGRITGVLDDRGNHPHMFTPHATRHTSHVTHTIGKFICITPDEMQSVQKFITQRGRVSIADLAVESNRCVSKQPHPLKRTHTHTDATLTAHRA